MKKLWQGGFVVALILLAFYSALITEDVVRVKRQNENLMSILVETKTEAAIALRSEKEKSTKQMQDLLRNVEYLGKVERLRSSVLTMPIEQLMERDINKLIEEELIALPISSPIQGGYKITAHYGDDVLEGHWRTHKGTDMVPETSGFIYPSAPGTIIEIGSNAIYGKYILIQHDGFQTFYAHLKTIYWQDTEEQKVIGEEVTVDTRIGFYGNTGDVTPIIGDGSHLHYEVRWHDATKDVYVPINPEEFLTAGQALAERSNEKEVTT